MLGFGTRCIDQKLREMKNLHFMWVTGLHDANSLHLKVYETPLVIWLLLNQERRKDL